MQQNFLNNFICLNYEHNEQQISFLCLEKYCNRPRLSCVECVKDHTHHGSSLRTFPQLIDEIKQHLSTENKLAKVALQKFQQLKCKLIDSLNIIETELQRVCSINIPNESASELLIHLNKLEYNKEELDQKISNYLKTTTDEQVQKQEAQRNISIDYQCKFSLQIKNYLNKLNELLAQFPKFNFKPQNQRVLQMPAQDFGKKYQNKIGPDKYLIQQFSVNHPVRLNGIKHGKIEGEGNQKRNRKAILQIFYKYRLDVACNLAQSSYVFVSQSEILYFYKLLRKPKDPRIFIKSDHIIELNFFTPSTNLDQQQNLCPEIFYHRVLI